MLRETTPGYVAFLALLCALPPLSIDMGLPALPALASTLDTTPAQAAMTVSLFMAGFAASPIAYGLLSDRYGRRPLMLGGLSLFVLGGVACVTAPGIGWLLAARLLQGAGAGAGPTLAFAATRDRLRGKAMGKRLAFLTMLLNTAPVIAPTLGTGILALTGWRGIYAVLTGAGLVLSAAACGFNETLAPAPFGVLRPSMLAILRHAAAGLQSRPHVLAYGAVYGFAAGSMFAYVSTSPLLLMRTLGAGSSTYAALFAVTASGIVLGAYLSGLALHRLQVGWILTLGLILSLAGPGCVAFLLLTGEGGLPQVIACLAIATFGYGLIAPVAAHATLDPVPEMAGMAAAIMNSFQMICMSLSSLGAALLFQRLGALAIPIVMAAFGSLAVLCLVLTILAPAQARQVHGG